MKISNLGVTSTPPTSQQPADAISTGREPGSAVGAAGETSAYTPSPELTQLVNLVRGQSDVRPDRVQAALQRLQQGYYQTPTAADETAVAMLGALD